MIWYEQAEKSVAGLMLLHYCWITTAWNRIQHNIIYVTDDSSIRWHRSYSGHFGLKGSEDTSYVFIYVNGIVKHLYIQLHRYITSTCTSRCTLDQISYINCEIRNSTISVYDSLTLTLFSLLVQVFTVAVHNKQTWAQSLREKAFCVLKKALNVVIVKIRAKSKLSPSRVSLKWSSFFFFYLSS